MINKIQTQKNFKKGYLQFEIIGVRLSSVSKFISLNPLERGTQFLCRNATLGVNPFKR